MKKNILIIVLLSFLVLFATSCGSKDVKETKEKGTKRGLDYLVLVNKQHKLPDDWEKKVELKEDKDAWGDKVLVEKEALKEFKKLREALLKENVDIELDSIYRSVKEQQNLWDEWSKDPKKGPEYVKKFVAVPGYSEHHTGLAIDVCLKKNGKIIADNDEMIAEKKIFAKVHKKLADYGFILRYPEGKKEITGYEYEPWHFRYVGEEAKKIELTGLTLEEYLAGSNEYYINDNEKLYDKAIEYLKEEDKKENSKYKKEDYYKFFVTYDGLGITKKDKNKYAYMWILKESHYLKDKKVQDGESASMFYKFTFKDDKVVKYENPEEGGHYTKSIKKMSIDNKMSEKILKYNSKLSNDKEVKKYYEKVSNPKKLTKRDIMGDNKLLFTISKRNNKCVPISLNVYDSKYELYTEYKDCKGKLCNDKLEYTKKNTGKYTYDVIKIIKNSKNADLLLAKELEEYEIYTGKNDYVYMMSTGKDNKYLKDFLKEIKVDLDECAKKSK